MSTLCTYSSKRSREEDEMYEVSSKQRLWPPNNFDIMDTSATRIRSRLSMLVDDISSKQTLWPPNNLELMGPPVSRSRCRLPVTMQELNTFREEWQWPSSKPKQTNKVLVGGPGIQQALHLAQTAVALTAKPETPPQVDPTAALWRTYFSMDKATRNAIASPYGRTIHNVTLGI